MRKTNDTEKNPCSWLEKDTKKTRDWIIKQKKQTFQYLNATKSRKVLQDRFKNLLRVDSEGLPVIRDDLYFFEKRKSYNNQPSIYIKHKKDKVPRLLLDPSKLKYGNLSNWHVSKDGEHMAIEFSKSSNDRCIIKIFDAKRKIFLTDTISAKGYPSFNIWNVNSSGFWYIRSKSENSKKDEKYNRQIYYHKIGKPVRGDKIFFGTKEGLTKRDWPWISQSASGKHQLITIVHQDETSTIFLHSAHKTGKFAEITTEIKADSRACLDDKNVYLITDHNAPNRKILTKEIPSGSFGKWQIFIPEKKYRLESWVLLKKYFVVEYIKSVSSEVKLINLSNKKEHPIKLPGIGSVDSYSASYDSPEFFYSFSSLKIPTRIYRLNSNTLKQTLYWKSPLTVPKGLELNQKWVKSKDGTRIPFFILNKKNQKRPRPTLVNAYGGFGVSELPSFHTLIIPFVEDGGTFVLANIRGGGEFGTKWHHAILKKNQHRRFEDFASVLKHLIVNKYCAPNQLAIWGESNGGLLMSVTVLRHPELIKAAIISVPVTDMLRFHLFHSGAWWIHEYGDPDLKSMRDYLLRYSPLHNVKSKNYPSMIFITGEHDDRVHPMHTYKFLYRLQENRQQTNPLLLRLEGKVGHSGSSKIDASITRLVDIFSFLYHELDMD